MKNLRTMLFMPGNNPGMLVSADILEADAIIYDLEDAVAIDQKDAARDLVSNALEKLSFHNSLVTVRINQQIHLFGRMTSKASSRKTLMP